MKAPSEISKPSAEKSQVQSIATFMLPASALFVLLFYTITSGLLIIGTWQTCKEVVVGTNICRSEATNNTAQFEPNSPYVPPDAILQLNPLLNVVVANVISASLGVSAVYSTYLLKGLTLITTGTLSDNRLGKLIAYAYAGLYILILVLMTITWTLQDHVTPNLLSENVVAGVTLLLTGAATYLGLRQTFKSANS